MNVVIFFSLILRRLAVRGRLVGCLLLACALWPSLPARAAPPAPPAAFASKITPERWARAQSGEQREWLVLFEAGAAAQSMDAARLAARAEHIRALRARALAALPAGDVVVLQDYRHIPMAFLRVRDGAALERLLARPEVAAVYVDTRLYPHLSQLLPLIGQTQVNQVMGRTGSGAAVAVLDTGVDYSRSEFGSCSAPGVPAGCRVVAALDTAPNDNARDANGHGTWVAGTATAVAPGAGIVAIDVFDGNSASSVDVIEGVDWAIDNRAVYNIVALNLSLGDGVKYTSACSSKLSNPYRQPIIDARNAGILSIVSSGNDGFTDGIASPACTPEAASVGATYDANVGARTWTSTDPDCTDSATAADKVVCFSNSASFLTMLAPGALTTVTGATVAGTSLSSPVITGAVAVLAQAFPADTASARLNRLTASGVAVTDTRNNVVKPRVNLLAAQGAPAHDAFAQAATLNGSSGTLSAWNLNATLEAGEPVHAATGGRSVWWQWTPGVSGIATLDTHGSGFDTLLAVYTGGSVSALTAVASNDNDGSAGNASGLGFNAVAGLTYRIAVDGKAAASGALALAWTLLQAQTISFPQPADMPLNASFSLAASASSGLTVSFASQTPAVCGVSGNVATLVAVGVCSVVARQAGGSGYAAAPDVVRSFNVTALTQTLSFPPVAGQTLGAAPFDVTVSASSGLPVSLATLTPAICGVSGHTVTLLAVGLCTLEATQSGNGAYAAAPAVMQTFSVADASTSGNDGDLPLPPWALLLLGAGLLTAMRRRLRTA